MHHGQRPQQWPSASAVKAVAFGQCCESSGLRPAEMLCPFRFAPSRCRSTRGSTPCTACGCSHSLAQPAAGHSVGDSKTQSGGRGLRPSQSCAPSGLGLVHSLKSQCAQCRFAPEERVCRFAPRSRFAPEQCVSFCRFAPRSRLQRQRGRDSVRIISLRSRLDPRARCGAKCCSQHAPRRTRALRSARGRLSPLLVCEPVWSVSI